MPELSTKTWALLPALNTLVKPNMLPDWLREPLMQTLTLLPLRPDGVRGTMEFVFSVHPSTSSQHGSTASRKQGALITHEAVAVATRLLSSVPASMTPEAWFSGISEQLFHLMDESEGPELARTAAQIVGFGILGKKQYGAPGKSTNPTSGLKHGTRKLTTPRCFWMECLHSAPVEHLEPHLEPSVYDFHPRRR